MSKLLFITQKVDKNDDVLGVYHRWIECLAEKVEKLNVICLYRGRNELPSKVGVFSLGKETYNADLRIKCESADCGYKGNQQSVSSACHSRNQHHSNTYFIQRLIYIIGFYRYIWQLRNNYDTVFVHMNPIYIILGGLFWKLSGKKIFLWYNHPMGNLRARVGISFADKVFCTSPYSFSAKFKKTELMPAGIDTDLFKPLPNIGKVKNRILSIGRISPIKNLEYLIEAAKILDAKGIDFELLIVGSPISADDRVYEAKLRDMSKDLLSKGKIIFQSSVPNHKTPEIYCGSSIFVNLTPTGSFDKTTLEAMSCGLLVLVSNKTFLGVFESDICGLLIFEERNSEDLSNKILFLINLEYAQINSISFLMRRIILESHSLVSLMDKLTSVVNGR